MKELGVLGYSRAAGLESMYKAFASEGGWEQAVFYPENSISRWAGLRWVLYSDWRAPAPLGMKKLAP